MLELEQQTCCDVAGLDLSQLRFTLNLVAVATKQETMTTNTTLLRRQVQGEFGGKCGSASSVATEGVC